MIQRNPTVKIRVQLPVLGTVLKRLRVSHHRQNSVLWCWVACLRMVLEQQSGTIGRPPRPGPTISGLTQCAIVSLVRGLRCCGQRRPPQCEAALAINRVVNAWKVFGFHVSALARPLTFQEVKKQIGDHRPIQIGVGIGGKGHVIGHSVLIYGFSESPNLTDQCVYIQNPLATGGSGGIPISDLKVGPLPWRWTWTNLPRVP